MNYRARGVRLAAVASLAIVGTGCLAPGPDPHRGSGLATTAPSATASRPPAPSSAAPASASLETGAGASPLAELPPVNVDVTRLTILCESWGGEHPPGTVECSDAVPLAIAALGNGRASVVRRLDVRFAGACPTEAGCDRRADVRAVAAISASFDSLVIRVARDASGELLVWPPPVDGPTVPPAAFSPPAARAPDLGADAPVEIRERTALPFCGTEVLNGPEGFDTAVRRCFLDGILGWQPVEMISSETTETDVVTRVIRFDGRRAIIDSIRVGDRWTATATAISPIDTPAVFVLTSPTDPVAIHR